MQDRLNDAKRRMEGASKALGQEFASVRTGRAWTYPPLPTLNFPIAKRKVLNHGRRSR